MTPQEMAYRLERGKRAHEYIERKKADRQRKIQTTLRAAALVIMAAAAVLYVATLVETAWTKAIHDAQTWEEKQ